MIKFSEINIDDDIWFLKTQKCFIECANNYLKYNKKEFIDWLKVKKVKDLNIELAKISYTKYFDGKFIVNDQSTELHIEIYSYVYVKDFEDDDELVASYRLILNSNFEIVDDIFTGI